MDFRKTEEQELLLESAREFGRRHFTEENIQAWYANRGMPDEVTLAYLEAGFGYMGIPEEFGGTPTSLLTQCMVTEEIVRSAGCTLPFMQNSVAIMDMLEFGSMEQIEMAMTEYKRNGKAFFSIAITEPGAGSDNSAMITTVTEKDGRLRLNGHKSFITNGEHFPYLLVVAKDEDPSPTNKQMSLWLVKADAPGVKIEKWNKLGQQIMPLSEVWFDDVELSEKDLVGERGKGFFNLMKNLEFERVLVCAVCVGMAQAAMDEAAAYTTERMIFGQQLSRYQLTQEKLTDMEIKIRTMRNMVYETAWKFDNGQPIQLDSALLKRYVPATTVDVCSAAVQIGGGASYLVESKLGRLWLDARGQQFAAGTDEIMVHICGRLLAKQYARK